MTDQPTGPGSRAAGPTRLATSPGTVTSPAQPPAADTPAGVRSLIDKHFALSDAARAALTKNLAARTTQSLNLAKRANAAFSSFSAFRLPDAVRADKTFVKAGDELKQVQFDAMSRGIATRQKASATHALRVASKPALEALLGGDADTTTGAVASIDPSALLNYVNSKSQGLHFSARETLVTECEAEIEAQRRMAAITGGTTTTTGGTTNPATTAEDPLSDLTTDQLVKQSVDTQMATVTPPEASLRYSSPDGSQQMQKAVQSFELRSGPSDVTSYHDFNNLQIAFENVWTQVFDERVKDIGRQLYEEYIKLKDFSGTDSGTDPDIGSVAELEALMAEIKSFADTTIQNVGPVAQGTGPGTGTTGGSQSGGGSGGGSVTVTEVVMDVLNPVQGIIDLISHL